MSRRAPDDAVGGPDIGATLDAMGCDGPIALAVSGGPDSLGLLLLAHAARPRGVIAATVNHGLRAEAGDEAAMVGRVCRDLAVPHMTLQTVVTFGGGGMQAAARAARYRALGAWARDAGASVLATAHHLDDQAETLLMRLARGSGTGGLAAIRAVRPLEEAPTIRLIRPLLGWRKAALEAVVRRAGLVPADDPANRDPRHDRTAMRALLAREPLLDPARLGASAHALGEGEEALAWMTSRLAAERVRKDGEGWTVDVADLPPELRRRLLANLVGPVRGETLARLVERLHANVAGTVGRWLIRPDGARWQVRPAPSRRLA